MSSYLENLTNLKIVAAFPLISVSFHLLFVVSAVRDWRQRPPEMTIPGSEVVSSYRMWTLSMLSCTLFMKVATIVSHSSLFNFSSYKRQSLFIINFSL